MYVCIYIYTFENKTCSQSLQIALHHPTLVSRCRACFSATHSPTNEKLPVRRGDGRGLPQRERVGRRSPWSATPAVLASAMVWE